MSLYLTNSTDDTLSAGKRLFVDPARLRNAAGVTFPYDVDSTPPPTRDMRLHHRPLPRRSRNAKMVFSRVQIMGSAHPKLPFFLRALHTDLLPQVAEGVL